eukprot:1353435-Rhodomonas_salina.3
MCVYILLDLERGLGQQESGPQQKKAGTGLLARVGHDVLGEAEGLHPALALDLHPLAALDDGEREVGQEPPLQRLPELPSPPPTPQQQASASDATAHTPARMQASRAKEPPTQQNTTRKRANRASRAKGRARGPWRCRRGACRRRSSTCAPANNTHHTLSRTQNPHTLALQALSSEPWSRRADDAGGEVARAGAELDGGRGAVGAEDEADGVEHVDGERDALVEVRGALLAVDQQEVVERLHLDDRAAPHPPS